MRVTDVLISLPRLVLAIAIGAALGPSLKNAMLALVIVWTPFYVRMIYGQAQADVAAVRHVRSGTHEHPARERAREAGAVRAPQGPADGQRGAPDHSERE